MKAKRAIAMAMALVVLLTGIGLTEEGGETSKGEFVESVSVELEPETNAEAESLAGSEEETELPKPEMENDESSAPEPEAPSVQIDSTWEYDPGIGAITIPYTDLPETLRFAWTFEGEAVQYAVQTAPVPEGDAPETRGERIYTNDPYIVLPAADFAEGGWFSLYVIAILGDGAEIEGWKYFRLEELPALTDDEIEERSNAQAQEALHTAQMPVNASISETSAESKIFIYDQGYCGHNVAGNLQVSYDGKMYGVNEKGCNLYTHLHAYQWLTGDKRNASNAKALMETFTRDVLQNGKYDVRDSDDPYFNYFSNYSIEREVCSYMSESEVVSFLKSGGVIKAAIPDRTHIFLAVGCASADLDGNGKTENYFHIVDSAAYYTLGRVTSGIYSFTNHAPLTKAKLQQNNARSENNYAALEYWMRGDTFMSGTLVWGYRKSVPVKSIQLNTNSLSLKAKESFQLSATVLPAEARDHSVSWSSSDTNVAYVFSDGKVNAIHGGTAVITCRSNANSSVTATCTITVKEDIKVSSITLNQTSVTLNKSKGETITLIATPLPSNATNKTLSWSSGNSSVATVVNGKITPIGKGYTTITCASTDGGYVTATCSVTVTEDVKVTSIALNPPILTLNKSKGETATLTATVYPTDATNKNLSWSSSNDAIAMVSGGRIIPVSKGIATITCAATDGSGAKATCAVTVIEDIKVIYIELSQTKLTLTTVQSATLTASVYPSDATNKRVVWMSDDEEVARVENGLVEAVGVGSATIICTAADGSGTRAKCDVTVKKAPAPKSVTIAPKSGKINIGDVLQLTAKLKPNGASTTLKWSSANPKIAKVNANGTVTGIREGVAKITVKTKNNKTAVVKIKVVDPTKPTKVKMSVTGTAKLNLGSVLYLSATMEPATASSELKWSTSNKKIAKVVDGVVTPVREGTVTITVKTVRAGKTAKVKVKVVDPTKPTKVSLDPVGTIKMKKGSVLLLKATITPSTAADSKLRWNSSNKKVVTVTSNGLIGAKKVGSATITVETANGKKASVKVKVTDP